MGVCQTRRYVSMKRTNFIFFIFTVLFFNTALYAESQGEKLFKENNAKDAVELLEYEILNGQISANTYNFLGLGYYQLGEYSKSIDAFNRGIKEQPSISKLLKYNQGNTYYAMKDFTSAASCYSDAIKEDDKFFDAYLNRANALLMANQLTNSRDEYIHYLQICPNDPQRARIEELIKALTDEIARREEEERLFAEQNKAKWEEVDGSIEELAMESEEEPSAEWEKVDVGLKEEPKQPEEVEKGPDWEKVQPEKVAKVDEPVNKKVEEPYSENWESVGSGKDPDLGELYAEKETPQQVSWDDLSTEDQDELKLLDKQSKEEYEKWLEEQRKEKLRREAEMKEKESANDVTRKYLEEEEERRKRDQIMTEMMKAENERKQKLLDDLANSLQNTEATNLSSGSDDIMEYDLEGELD